MKKKITIILQARCNSKRFPFKSLHPINNLPLVIYCSKRLTKNTNHNLIIATTKKEEDTEIVKLAKKYKIKVYRGSEKNVLKRFKSISKNLGNEDIIVRATGDNPLPDSQFLNKSLSLFNKYKLDYFVTDNNFFKIPYGLNLEIFKVKCLRKQKHNKLNNEHVTFTLRKMSKLNHIKEKFSRKDYSKLKFSIDTVEDYLRVKSHLEQFKIYDNWNKILQN